MNSLPFVVLAIDDELDELDKIRTLVDPLPIRVASSLTIAKKLLEQSTFQLIILDEYLSNGERGTELIRWIRTYDKKTPIILYSVTTSFADVREAYTSGASLFLNKIKEQHRLREYCSRQFETHTELRNAKDYNIQIDTHRSLMGKSLRFQENLRMLEKIAKRPIATLINGETGTGKELAARYFHKCFDPSGRHPFVGIDCSTLQTTMAESILFGHERGAFTGAHTTTQGILEQAHEGTLFLDEIGNMSLEVQMKFLRALEEKKIRRVGGSKEIPTRFNLISATNQNLNNSVNNGKFLPDLLQRIAIARIEMPPLRERRDEIPFLIRGFIEEFFETPNQLAIDPEFHTLLNNYSWPGNIRELRNTISYCATMYDAPHLKPSCLPQHMHQMVTHEEPADTSQEINDAETSYDSLIRTIEQKTLAQYYDQCGQSVTKMARLLKMDRSHLHHKLKKFGIWISKESGHREAER